MPDHRYNTEISHNAAKLMLMLLSQSCIAEGPPVLGMLPLPLHIRTGSIRSDIAEGHLLWTCLLCRWR